MMIEKTTTTIAYADARAVAEPPPIDSLERSKGRGRAGTAAGHDVDRVERLDDVNRAEQRAELR